MGVEMLERLVETFCAVDDFCKAFLPQWQAYLIGNGTAPRGPSYERFVAIQPSVLIPLLCFLLSRLVLLRYKPA